MDPPEVPYAEVIGDPIHQSLSPIIHNHWLGQLGIAGTYRRQRCAPGKFQEYLDSRRRDPLWRGCNVTMPLKEEAAALLARKDLGGIGAVNLLVRAGDAFIGRNTDVAGIGCALGGSSLVGERAVVIGAGGSARAAIVALASRGACVTILARDPDKAEPLSRLADRIIVLPIEAAKAAIAGAGAIVNASPLGMHGSPGMPPFILAALPLAASRAIALDLVYRPLETGFLTAAAAAGLRTSDGLTILVGQARPAFHAFFGTVPPADEAELRALLAKELRAG